MGDGEAPYSVTRGLRKAQANGLNEHTSTTNTIARNFDVPIPQATVRVSKPPSVESQLQTQRLARGEMLAIVATASGVPQPQYQWRRNGVPIPGANRPMLVRHSVTEEDMGTYTCDVRVALQTIAKLLVTGLFSQQVVLS